DADRDLPHARAGGAPDPPDRAEPGRGDLAGRPPAGHGRRRDRRRDDREAAGGRPGAAAPVSRRRAGRALRPRLGVAAVGLAALLAAGCGGSSAPKGPPALVFVSVRNGDYAIFGADAEGKHEYLLTEHEADPSTPRGLFFQNDPAWSPDGRRIAFASNRDGRTHLFVMNADGTGTRRVTNTAHSDEHPSWSPDGRRIVFAREGAIYEVPARGGAGKRLGKGFGAAADPAYSPDGRLIAYDYRQPGYSIKDIYLMKADGTGARRITALREVSTYPAWSPDGT